MLPGIHTVLVTNIYQNKESSDGCALFTDSFIAFGTTDAVRLGEPR